jgi:hypothetical protein
MTNWVNLKQIDTIKMLEKRDISGKIFWQQPAVSIRYLQNDLSVNVTVINLLTFMISLSKVILFKLQCNKPCIIIIIQVSSSSRVDETINFDLRVWQRNTNSKIEWQYILKDFFIFELQSNELDSLEYREFFYLNAKRIA